MLKLISHVHTKKSAGPTSNCLLFIVVLLAMSMSSIGCRSRVRPPAEHDVSAEHAPPRIAGILLETLSKANLHTEWVQTLPMDRSKHIRQIFYRNGRLYVLNDHNKLYALDGAKGTILWSTKNLATPHSSSPPVQFYRDNLLFVFGNTFFQIREHDGQVSPEAGLELKFPVATTVARSGTWLFVGSTNNRFYCIRAEDAVPLWQAVCPAQPVGTVAVDKNHVYFTCQNGTLYVSALDKRIPVWEASTAGQMPGVTVDRNQCYLPSSDTALYCFDPNTGTPLWPPHLAGGSLIELPTLTDDVVYQPLKYGTLLCIDRKNGSLRWELKNGRGLLAENGPVTYAMTIDKELTIIENATGKRLLSFHVFQMDHFVRNNEDSMIFLASKTGEILALKPD